MADAIASASADGRLRAEHFIHLRCEVSVPDVVDHFDELRGNKRVRLASLMDHAPVKGNSSAWKPIASIIRARRSSATSNSPPIVSDVSRNPLQFRAQPPALSRSLPRAGISIASHDDATREHVEESVSLRVALAEFPTTIEAATLSRDAGLHVLMGAPNVVRVGSHSGNVSAIDLLHAGALDILSSDYVPFSLVQAAFLLANRDDISCLMRYA